MDTPALPPVDERIKLLKALQTILPRFAKDASHLGLHEVSLLLGTTHKAVESALNDLSALLEE